MSIASEITIKQNFAVIDDTFVAAAVSDYELNILISEQYIQLAVLDIKRQIYICVKEYEVEQQSFLSQPDLLQKISDKDSWFGLPFQKVKLAFFFPKNILIPVQLSLDIDKFLLAKNHFNILANESLQLFKYAHLDMYCYMAVPKIALEWVKKSFSLGKLLALPVCFLQKSFLLDSNTHIWIDGRNMLLSVVKERQLVFYNTFNYNSIEEVVYFLLFTLQQIGFDNSQNTLEIGGAIVEGDKLFNLLNKYIHKVNITPKTAGFYFAPALQGIPTQRFDLLYFIHHCE